MNDFGFTFHHLGLAVREPNPAAVFLKGLGYRLTDTVFDPEQQVNAVMALHDHMPDVEILWSTGSGGPLDRMLEKHPKGLTYHVCFSVENLRESLSRVAAAGLNAVCISPPKRAIQFGDKRISFYLIQSFGLVEIIHG